MTMAVSTAVAEISRTLLIERTQSGLARARAEGKSLGRPSALTPEEQAAVLAKLVAGISISQVARMHNVAR